MGFWKIARLISLLSLTIVAFGTGMKSSAFHEEGPPWQVIDSVFTNQPWNPMAEGQWLYEIRFPANSDSPTIERVIEPEVLSVGDSVLGGIRLFADPVRREIFVYDARTRGLRTWPIPSDSYAFFYAFAVSPGGRFLAYVKRNQSGGPLAALIALETETILYEGPMGGGCDCDSDWNYARWITRDSFQVSVVSTADGLGWIVTSGNAATLRVGVDTVPRMPDWYR